MSGVEIAIICGSIVGVVAAISLIGGCAYGWWNHRRQGLPSHISKV